MKDATASLGVQNVTKTCQHQQRPRKDVVEETCDTTSLLQNCRRSNTKFPKKYFVTFGRHNTCVLCETVSVSQTRQEIRIPWSL